MHEANIVTSVYMLEYTCSSLNMLIHAYVLVAAFASAHNQC